MSDITCALNELQQGDPQRHEHQILRVYTELRALARRKMADEPPEHTLQATALVHEVWLRLVARNRSEWHNRAEFFSAAGEAMRRILVDHARRKKSQKRGGGLEREPLTEEALMMTVPPEELVAVDEALGELAQEDAALAELVKLRYFVGMSMPEAATALGLSLRTAERLWTFARAWLKSAIRRGEYSCRV